MMPHFLRARRIYLVPLFILCLNLTANAQVGKSKAPNFEQQLQQRYDSARTFQISGDNARAQAEYRGFLGAVLNGLGNAQLGAHDLASAADFYRKALAADSNSVDAAVGLAFLRLQQGKLEEAEQLAQGATKIEPNNVQALTVLGRIAYRRGDYKQAREALEPAIVAKPSFDLGYLLGSTYIALRDFKRVRLLFDDMITGLGDSAQLHIYFGRAYADGETEGLDQAIEEFKKAIAKDPKVPQAHYFLALAYLNRDGESGFVEAAPQLKTETELNPGDSRSHYLLGYIAMKQRRTAEAETELQEAAKLDPRNPEALMFLGQLYSETNRDDQAEAVLRNAIELTTDVSRGDYQINRAHYVLGRILLRTGRAEEGQRHLAISKELRDHTRNPEQLNELAALKASSKGDSESELLDAPVAPEAKQRAETLVNQFRPAVADAYNNLGVIMASEKKFDDAFAYFKEARTWQPTLPTLDRNLGMAAFYANNFRDAIEPLYRQLQQKPDDVRVRAALGMSYFMTQKFARVLEMLKPLEVEVEGDPGLSYAYAVSLIKTGEYNDGVRRLKLLENSSENAADIHALLGQAYADQNDYPAAIEEYKKSLATNGEQPQTHYLYGIALLKNGNPAGAVPELREALKSSPDAGKKYHLAFSLIQLQQKDEARELLKQVIQQDPKYADAYYELGKLQMEQGDTKAAIASFEAGTDLSPDSDYIHYQLAMAYRRDSRTEDAERQIKLYQALKNRNRGRDASQAN